MTSFLPVNNVPTSNDHPMEEAASPTTPRPPTSSLPASQEVSRTAKTEKGEGSSQDSCQPVASSQSAPSIASTGDETAVVESEGDRDGSQSEAEVNGSGPPSKKKKGQRFFCTDFPPCTLSFTRSEHLARHIRKHTGERPFQCHCSRRFSRLDNLRQHAQTVHVNEEIPGDSLAATGTRFQRQIRTDRVRPPGRARSGTGGSQGSHSRGHSRNLSTSSIASTASTLSQAPEIRRRPPPLIMANDGTARARLTLDTMGEPPSTPPGQIRALPGQSPGGTPYAPPNVFVAGGGSPHFGSPLSASSHTSGFWEGKGHARRLSVPSGANPFMPVQGGSYPPQYISTVHPSQSPFSGAAALYASPTSSSYSSVRDESALSPSEAEIRRRTWHPSSTYSTYPRPATSGLSRYETSDSIRPTFAVVGPNDLPPRLPGIESFDQVIPQGRPMTPPLRKPSPMQIDSPSRAPPAPTASQGFTPGFASQVPPQVRPPPPISGPGHRRGHVSWDMSLHSNLTGLSLRGSTPQRDVPQWNQQSRRELQSVGSRPLAAYQTPSSAQNTPSRDRLGLTEKAPTQESTVVPNHKRQGRHNGLVISSAPGSQAPRTSPEDSSSSDGVTTPSTSSLEYHPAIVHSNGYVEPQHPSILADLSQNTCTPFPSQPNGYHANPDPEPRRDFFPGSSAPVSGMGRLEALVAVATSENKGGARFF
ncbi:hypothetical protein V8E54_009178 [Elaphomyces granulatus]